MYVFRIIWEFRKIKRKKIDQRFCLSFKEKKVIYCFLPKPKPNFVIGPSPSIWRDFYLAIYVLIFNAKKRYIAFFLQHGSRNDLYLLDLMALVFISEGIFSVFPCCCSVHPQSADASVCFLQNRGSSSSTGKRLFWAK